MNQRANESPSTYPGNLFVVAAPSGAGKSSLVSSLLEVDSHLVVAVSHTTRIPRGRFGNPARRRRNAPARARAGMIRARGRATAPPYFRATAPK